MDNLQQADNIPKLHSIPFIPEFINVFLTDKEKPKGVTGGKSLTGRLLISQRSPHKLKVNFRFMSRSILVLLSFV